LIYSKDVQLYVKIIQKVAENAPYFVKILAIM